MAERRFCLSPEREAESLATAFYLFLDIHSQALAGVENACGIKTIVEERMHVKIVTLWDEQAATEFVRFWDDYRAEHLQPDPHWTQASGEMLAEVS